MSDLSPTRQQANPRALAIMDAARTCFEHHGFHAASMAKIAAASGMSVGHIYRYFENKEAVVAAIVGQDLEDISRDVAGLTGGPDEIAGQILDQVRCNRSGRSMILWLEVRAEGARNPKVAAMIRQADESIRNVVRRTILLSWERRGFSCGAAERELDVRVSLVGVLIEGLQMRAFYEGATSPALMSHMRQLLAQVLSPAPMLAGSAVQNSQDRAGVG